MAYVNGPLDPETGVPVEDLKAIRRWVAQLRAEAPPLPTAVAERLSRILYNQRPDVPPLSARPRRRGGRVRRAGHDEAGGDGRAG